jgi:hypothetical protein
MKMSLPTPTNPVIRLMNLPVITQLEHNCHLTIDKAPHSINSAPLSCFFWIIRTFLTMPKKIFVDEDLINFELREDIDQRK